MATSARELRSLLIGYLTQPEYAETRSIDDEDDILLGVTLPDGSKFLLTIEKCADCTNSDGDLPKDKTP